MPSDKAKQLIAECNASLGRSRVKLEVHGSGDWISLRGTFPPKPGSKRIAPYQQRISLKMQARDRPTVREAMNQAKQVDLDLNRGEFNWYKFDGFEIPDQPVTIQDWVDSFEERWWQVNSNKDTWRTKYAYPFKTLLENFGQQPLSVELLTQWIVEYSPKDSDARKRFCKAARSLAELAGLPVNDLKLYKGGYSHKSVNPRDLPTDEEIIKTWEEITDPGWRFFYGMLATYGLRPHEVFKFEQLNQGLILVQDDTKTGARTVPPLHDEWFDLFELNNFIYPSQIKLDDAATNSQLGQKVSRWFYHAIGWTAYNLRHSYARRWFEKGLTSDVAAKFMGHSPTVHCQTYRAWIDEQVYLDLAKKLT